MTRRAVIFTTATAMAVGLIGSSTPAAAQQWDLEARGGLGTGVEAGDNGVGTVVFRRARTRVFAGVLGRIDERPKNAYELVGFAELEPHTSFGGELRLSRNLGGSTTGFAGLVGVAAPHTLFGGGFGLRVSLSEDLSTPTLFFEPSVSVLPLGTDIAGDQVLVWGLLSAGFHGEI